MIRILEKLSVQWNLLDEEEFQELEPLHIRLCLDRMTTDDATKFYYCFYGESGMP
jgi:hypothetical protein